MDDYYEELRNKIELLKTRILSKLHLNPDLDYAIGSFPCQFNEPLNYVASAVGSLAEEGRVVIRQEGNSLYIHLSDSEITAEVIIDPEVTRLKEEFRALSKREKEQRAIAKKEREASKKLTSDGFKSGRRALTIISPDGVRHSVTNLSKFCNEKGISRGAMYKLSYGNGSNYRGYSIE